MEQNLIEGIARVIAVKGDTVWLQPEQENSCGGCLSAATCGVKSGGTSRRLAARRFAMPNSFSGRIGERVVVGISEHALLRAATLAYAVPLLLMVGGALAGQGLVGTTFAAPAGAVLGLVGGLLLARARAGRLDARGELSPRFLRRLYGQGADQHCQTN